MKHFVLLLALILPLTLSGCGTLAKFEAAMEEGTRVLQAVQKHSGQAAEYLAQAKTVYAEVQALAPEIKKEMDTNKDGRVDFKEILLYLLSAAGVVTAGVWQAMNKLKQREAVKRGVIHERINELSKKA